MKVDSVNSMITRLRALRGGAIFFASFSLLQMLFTTGSLAAEDQITVKVDQNRQPIMKAPQMVAGIANDPVDDEALLSLYFREKDLMVRTPTRGLKHISKVAENITVITRDEIQSMNAHYLQEVLQQVTGLFVDGNQDFGDVPQLFIQGSYMRHVPVLLDGIELSLASSGATQLNAIPIEIVERVEVIKGPASSSWGSSLGGVINIITQTAEPNSDMTGVVQGSYGESSTRDYRARLSGGSGSLAYYCYVGRQASDGLRNGRHFEDQNIFSKLRYSPADDLSMGVMMGYSAPEKASGDYPEGDTSTQHDARMGYISTSVDADLFSGVSMRLKGYYLDQKVDMLTHSLGLGFLTESPELLSDLIDEQQIIGGSATFKWSDSNHSIVLGIDMERIEMEILVIQGELGQSYGALPEVETYTKQDRLAVFINDTIDLGRWTVTPGLRFDDLDEMEGIFSPSLGITYQITENSLVRSSISKGFSSPPLTMSETGGFFVDPNPDLEPETIWSYQAGIESSDLRYVWLKTMLFYHDMDKEIQRELYAGGPPAYNDLHFNRSNVRRHGFEVEAETHSFGGVSLIGGFVYLDISPHDSSGSDEQYAAQLSMKYKGPYNFQALLSGRYVWWDLPAEEMASYDDMIWDLYLQKPIYGSDLLQGKLFISARNLFNGSQYSFPLAQNPERWVEAGVRIEF